MSRKHTATSQSCESDGHQSQVLEDQATQLPRSRHRSRRRRSWPGDGARAWSSRRAPSEVAPASLTRRSRSVKVSRNARDYERCRPPSRIISIRVKHHAMELAQHDGVRQKQAQPLEDTEERLPSARQASLIGVAELRILTTEHVTVINTVECFVPRWRQPDAPLPRRPEATGRHGRPCLESGRRTRAAEATCYHPVARTQSPLCDAYSNQDTGSTP